MIIREVEGLAIVIFPKEFIKELLWTDGDEVSAICSTVDLTFKRPGDREVKYKRNPSKIYEIR